MEIDFFVLGFVVVFLRIKDLKENAEQVFINTALFILIV